ncbi:MAG: DUF1284 domain-containing protein [Clostridia bacterium]|nr:DUF1284 domain-containing protein [Clostridia bacterium]
MDIKLRPHHLLCISFFEGEGYSEQFVSNMQSVIDKLREHKLFRLTLGKDCICACCPLYTSECADIDKVTTYDNIVMRLLRLSADTIYNYDDIVIKVKENILDKGLTVDICGDCQYAYICHNGHDA